MASIFGQIDPASFALAIIGALWASEQGFSTMVKDALKHYNIKILRTIQSSYDRTDLLRPLLRTNHDLSDVSVSLLCENMVSTFKISSFFLWLSIKTSIVAQNATFALFKIVFILLATLFHFLHSLIYRGLRPDGAWVFDLEWSELTVKMAIEELKTQVVGDNLLTILYQVSQCKSGPLACKLPSNNLADERVSLAELLVTAFAIYNVDGSQVVETHDISVLNLATITFESFAALQPNKITVNIYIDEITLQFWIDVLDRCKDKSADAYLLQYAISTNNTWLYHAVSCKYEDGSPSAKILQMSIAAGKAISMHKRGTSGFGIAQSCYSDWIHTNFSHNKRLPWCQHQHFTKCHCWLTHFLIMESGVVRDENLSTSDRSVIVVSKNETEAVELLGLQEDTTGAYVTLSSQSQIISNSNQFRRTNRTVIAGAEEAGMKFTHQINKKEARPWSRTKKETKSKNLRHCAIAIE